MNKRRKFLSKLAAIMGLGSVSYDLSAEAKLDYNSNSDLAAMTTTPFIGQIAIFGFNFAPSGWAKCDGQLLPIAQNAALFSLIGTAYGGDGMTTFGLPDLRGRTGVHVGTGFGLTPRTLGSQYGTEDNTLSQSNLPAHNHTTSQIISNDNANNNFASSTVVLGNTNQAKYIESSESSNNVTVNGQNTGSTGNGTSFTNMQPSLTLNYCIALTGTFPS